MSDTLAMTGTRCVTAFIKVLYSALLLWLDLSLALDGLWYMRPPPPDSPYSHCTDAVRFRFSSRKQHMYSRVSRVG